MTWVAASKRLIFVYFALGIFAEFESYSYFQVVGRVLLSDVPEARIYGISALSAAAGAALFLVVKHIAAPLLARVFVTAAFALAVLMLGLVGILQTDSAYWVSLVVFSVMQGVNTALCAYCLHRVIGVQKRTGLMTAVALVAGLAVNYATDYLSPNAGPVNLISLVACILVMFALAVRKLDIFDLIASKDEPHRPPEARRNYLPMIIAVSGATVVMSYMIGVNDAVIITGLLSDPNLSFFIPQALFYLPALIAAGILADLGRGRFLPIATLVCTLAIMPSVIRLTAPEIFAQYSGVTYFIGGFYLIYIMFGLVSLAWRSRCPYFITSLVVGIYFLFDALGAFTSHIYIRADNAFLLAAYAGIVVLLLVIFYLSGSLQPRLSKIVPEKEAIKAAPDIEDLAAKYGITKREMDVLRCLADGLSTADISTHMNITEHSVQKYISSMMGKTGVSSRTGLLAKFTKQE